MRRFILHAAVLTVLLFVDVSGRGAFRAMFPESYPPMIQNGIDPGKPLYLSPYLKKGDINQAQKLSMVGPLTGTSVKSYAGLITVNETYQSNMFFWFFPAQVDSLNAPVLLWLQGGSGGSSMFGLFVEHGPFMVDQNFMLKERMLTWNKKYSMLYVDNPVGTGFSFTKADAGYATNEVDVANDLYSFLTQFFQIYFQFQKNDFCVTGESYAGKYVPAISYKIHMENKISDFKINFVGMAIGDGLCDPQSMMNMYAPFMYSIGMLDEKDRDHAAYLTDKAVTSIKNKQFMEAYKIYDMLLFNGDLYKYPSFFHNVTGTTNFYNYLLTKEPADFDYYGHYLAKPEVRAAIHVGNLTFNDGNEVEIHLMNDVMDTVKPWIETLIDNYKVMFYNGQLDIIIAVPLTEAFLEAADWSGHQNYTQAQRFIWKINPDDEEVAGYAKRVNSFYQIIVRGAGHILPYDQPERGLEMIQRFIENRSGTW